LLQNEGRDRTQRLRRMREARFGLFVHWGLYSVAARHEWVKQRERLDDTRYQRYFCPWDSALTGYKAANSSAPDTGPPGHCPRRARLGPRSDDRLQSGVVGRPGHLMST
jgi:hypothetical protein